MALQKTYQFKGLEITDGYHLVSFARYGKLNNGVTFRVDSYVSKDVRDSSLQSSLFSEVYDFTPSGSYDVVGNDISTACYSYLKTLDNWSGSVDV